MQKFVKYKHTGIISPVPDGHFALNHPDYEVIELEAENTVDSKPEPVKESKRKAKE
jgi:hypothetical protein